MTRGHGLPRLAMWFILNAGSVRPSNAATSTGMYSGLHPAMTALIASFSAVRAEARASYDPMTSCASSPAWARQDSMRSRVGATMGRPSVQPCSQKYSIAAYSSATSTLLERKSKSVASPPTKPGAL